MFKSYLKLTVRNLRRNKTYSIINILGLSIGIACTIMILLWVSDELSYDRFHQKGDRIYRIINNSDGIRSDGSCGALAPAIKREVPEISDAVRFWYPDTWQLYYGEKNIKRVGNYADPSVFEIFSFPLIQGNAKTALLDQHSVVITESIAKSLFEDKEVLGKIIHIRNRLGEKEPFVVTGVMRDVPRHSHIQFDFLFSFNLLKEWYYPDFAERWRNHSFPVYILVKDNSDISLINWKISECYQKNTGNKREFFLQPLSDIYLNAEINNHSGGDITHIRLFTGIAFFILLISCINYMNLATAQSAKRSKEIALQKVIGASKKQLIAYQFYESLFYTFLAFAAALLIIELVKPVFHSFTGVDIDLDFLDPTFLTVVFSIILITGLLSGSYPAIYLSSCKPIHTLKGMYRNGKSASSSRKILIIFQFTLTIIIIIASFVTYSQMKFIKTKNLGFDKENLIFTWTSGFNNDAIRQELLKNPNIVNACGSGAQLDWIGWWQSVTNWDGHTGDRSVQFGILEVDYHFLDTYGIELANGRFYSQDFSSDQEQAIVINENAVKAMQIEDPVGKSLNFNGVKKRIVGVVKDFHFKSLRSTITPLLLVLYPKQLRCLGIRVKNENISATLRHIKNVISRFEPDYILEYKFLEEQLNSLYLKEQFRNTLFAVFSFISIVLSCLGLFGLISYVVEQRTKEIGIRKVVGATILNIVTLLTNDFIKWILIANVIAWPVAYYFMNEWLQDFAYRIDISWWMFVLSGSIALVIALLTISFQAIKAAVANPVDSLRSE